MTLCHLDQKMTSEISPRRRRPTPFVRDTVPTPTRPLASLALSATRNRAGLLYACALFAAWRRYTSAAIGSAETWGPRWLAALVAKAFSSLMDRAGSPFVRHVVAQPCEPDRRYLVVWHPHAAYTTMALFHTSLLCVRGTPITWFPGVAPFLFSVPFLREALLLLNARSCDSRVVARLAEQGVTVGLQPGGVPEQLQSRGFWLPWITISRGTST